MFPPASDEARQREREILERIKELDLRHRNRLRRSGVGAALSLRFLRTLVQGLATRPRAVRAEPVPHPGPGALSVTFVGHATVMITSPAARAITDPVFDEFLYGMRRRRAAALAPADADDVSVILLSHAHPDHLRPSSLRRLPRTAELVVPARTGALVTKLGFREVVELAPGEAHQHRDLTIRAVPARHEGGRSRRLPACGFVVASADASVYFAGDTGYFSGFFEIGRRFRPDVALLPIGGYDPLPLRSMHMSPLDAVYAFEDLRARVLVPIAHGSFALGYEPPDEPLAWLRQAAAERGCSARLAVLDHGETLVAHRRPTVVDDASSLR